MANVRNINQMIRFLLAQESVDVDDQRSGGENVHVLEAMGFAL